MPDQRMEQIYNMVTQLIQIVANNTAHLEELRQGQKELFDGQERAYAAIEELRDGQGKNEIAIRELRDGQERTNIAIQELRDGQEKLFEGLQRLEEKLDGFIESTDDRLEDLGYKIDYTLLTLTKQDIRISASEKKLAQMRLANRSVNA